MSKNGGRLFLQSTKTKTIYAQIITDTAIPTLTTDSLGVSRG